MTEPTTRIAELAEQLKNASALESPALAEELNHLVERIGPQLADSVRSAQALSAIASDPVFRENLEQVANAAKQVQVDQAQFAQIAAEFRRFQESGVLDQVVAAAREIRADHVQFAQIALELRRLQESGVLDEVLKYQQQLAEVVESIRRITGRSTA